MGKEEEMEKKKMDSRLILEKSRKAKEKRNTKALQKKIGKPKETAKFHKVNFNG